jgi:SSS family solute:Na+ symporter
LVLAKTDIRSAYSTFIELLGTLGGILSALFVLGIFTRRAHAIGTLSGAVVAATIVMTIRWIQPLQVFAYAPIGLLTCVTVGYLFSLIIPAKQPSLQGLTLFTADAKEE